MSHYQREVVLDDNVSSTVNNLQNIINTRQPYQKPRNMIVHREPILPDHINTIKTIIIRLCDYGQQSVEEQGNLSININAVAEMLVSAGDIILEPIEIGNVFINAIKCLSMQSTIVSTLVAMIFRLNKDFPAHLINSLSKELLQSLENDNVLVSKLILRSMASLCCSNCLSFSGSDSLLEVFDALLSIAEKPFTDADGVTIDGYKSKQGEVAAYLVSSTVCWCSTLFKPDDEQASSIKKRILSLCHNITDKRRSPFDVGGQQAIFQVMNFSPECVNLSKGPENVMSWDSLWDFCNMAIYTLENQLEPAEIECMVMPWLKLEEELNKEIDYPLLTLSASIKDAIIDLDNNSKIGCTARMSMPNGSPIGTATNLWLRPRFAILEADSSPPLEFLCSSLSPFQRQVAVSYYHDVLHFFEPVNRDNGALIGSLEMICKQLEAVSRVFPGDVKMEFMLVEVLFQLMMQQPINILKSALITRLLLEFCKKYEAFPAVIALCTTILFERVPEMDTSCWRELARWFSFHLGNTKFSWNWQHWESEYNEAVEGDPLRLFCHYFVDKCSRTYLPNQDASKKFPASFASFGANNMQPNCSLYADGAMTESLGKLRTMIERPIEHQIDEVEAFIEGQADIDIRAILQSIFVVSSLSSLSTQSLPPATLDSSFDRFGNIIRDCADTDENQAMVMQVLVEIYGHDGGMLHCVLEKFLRRAFLKVTSVAQWAVTKLDTLVSDPHIYAHAELVVDLTLEIIRAALHHRKELGDVVIADILNPSNIVKAPKADDGAGDMDDEDPIQIADEILHNAWHSCRSVYKSIVGTLMVRIIDAYQKRDKDDESIDPWITSATSLLQRVLRSYSGLQAHIKSITNESLGDNVDVQASIDAIKKEKDLYPIEILWKSYL